MRWDAGRPDQLLAKQPLDVPGSRPTRRSGGADGRIRIAPAPIRWSPRGRRSPGSRTHCDTAIRATAGRDRMRGRPHGDARAAWAASDGRRCAADRWRHRDRHRSFVRASFCRAEHIHRRVDLHTRFPHIRLAADNHPRHHGSNVRRPLRAIRPAVHRAQHDRTSALFHGGGRPTLARQDPRPARQEPVHQGPQRRHLVGGHAGRQAR